MVAMSFITVDETKRKFGEEKMSNSENIINEIISSLDIQSSYRKADSDMKSETEINGGSYGSLTDNGKHGMSNNIMYGNVSAENTIIANQRQSTAIIRNEVMKPTHQECTATVPNSLPSIVKDDSTTGLPSSGESSPLDLILNSQRHQVPFPLTLPPPILPTKIPPRAPSHYSSARHGLYMPRGRSMMPTTTNAQVLPLPNIMQPPPTIHRYTAMPAKESTKCNFNRWPAQMLNQPPPALPTSVGLTNKNSKIKVASNCENNKANKPDDNKADLNNNPEECLSEMPIMERIDKQSESKDSFGLRELAMSIRLSGTVQEKKIPYSPPRFPSACSIFNTSLNLDEGSKGCNIKGKRTSVMDLDELGFNAYFVRNFEPVHDHIESPFTNRVISPLTASCELLPEEYNVSRRIDNDKLPSIDPELRYTPTDKLFLFFYLAVGEELQLKAANQLFNRGWRYIKTAGVWIARIKDRQLDYRSATCESGTYQFFNVQTWRREHGQFTLPYEDLAEDPTIGPVSSRNIHPTQVLEASQVVGHGRISSGQTVAPPNRNASNDVGSRVVGSLPNLNQNHAYQNQFNASCHQSNTQYLTSLVNAAQTSNRRPILKEQQANFDKNTQMHLQDAMMKMMNSQYRSAPTIKASYY